MMKPRATLWLLLLSAGCSQHPKAMPPQQMPVARSIVARPLMPTSPLNLLRDPLIGGDGTTSYGQFRAYYEGGSTIPLTRTFQSVSPVGGAVSIEELRDLPAPSPASVSTVRVASSFLGGAGSFHASIWLSAGDQSVSPVSFASVASSVAVKLLDEKGAAVTSLTAGAPQMFGAREWVQFQTGAGVALPSGGWLSVELSDLSVTLQLAAPEVTTDAL